jgi:hypothetical protein
MVAFVTVAIIANGRSHRSPDHGIETGSPQGARNPVWRRIFCIIWIPLRLIGRYHRIP